MSNTLNIRISNSKDSCHISGPNPVLNITPVIDSTNVTLEWPRPEGRIETYVIRWWPVENPDDIHAKNVTESNDVTSVLFEENTVQRVLISDLMPGVQYSFVLYTVSYNLFSDITNLTTRTSKFRHSLVPRHKVLALLTRFNKRSYVSLFGWRLSNYFIEIVKEICLTTSTNTPVLESIPFMVISLLIACVLMFYWHDDILIRTCDTFVTLQTVLFSKIVNNHTL